MPRRYDASLLVLRRGAFRRVRLGRSYGPLVSISPSGRFVIALAQSTRPPYGVRRTTPLLLIDVVRGQRRTLDVVPGRGSPWSVRSNTVAWFEGEGRVAIDQGTGVSVVSTSTGRATRLTLPRVPGRVRHVDIIGLSRGEAAVAVQMDTSQGTALASAPVAGGQGRLLDSHVWIERPRIERSADGTRLLVTAAEGTRTPSTRQIFVTAGPDPLGDPWDVSGFPAR